MEMSDALDSRPPGSVLLSHGRRGSAVVPGPHDVSGRKTEWLSQKAPATAATSR